MLRVEGLHTYYGRVHVLKGISIEVNEGEIVAILGANGAGKTTLMNTICGIIPVNRGKVTFQGQDITNAPADRIVGLGLSLVPEGRQIFRSLTVMENLDLGAYLRYGKESKAKIKQDLEYVFTLFPVLRDRRNQVAKTLSGGEQQMLAIGRAVMTKPNTLLLDEPSIGLAPKVVQEILTCIESLRNNGTTVLLVEQNSKAALSIADRGYVLQVGEMVLEGSRTDLLENRDIRAMYLGSE